MQTPEQKTADVILDEPDIFIIGKKKYIAAKPTPATLIKVSAHISTLPKTITQGNIVQSTLAIAKDCEPTADIVATLILGQKRKANRIATWIRKRKYEDLKQRILCDLSNDEMNEMVSKLLKRMEIASFFAFTTSLIEINMLKPTREVETKTIQSGQ